LVLGAFFVAYPLTRPTTSRLLLVAFCVTLVVNCFAAAAQVHAPAGTTASMDVLEHAISLLGNPSSNYRQVLLDALAAFPNDADERLQAGIRSFLVRAPEPGDQFKCTADFVRSRARKALLRLRDTLRNEYTGPLEADVCYAVPSALDAARRSGWLDIYGYDFDRVTPEMVLVTSESYREVTAALVTRSHYHLAFRLGDPAVPWSSKDLSLGVTWGHVIRHSIAIVRSTSRLCSSHVETIPAGRVMSSSVSGIDANDLRPPATTVRADLRLDYSSNKLEATMCVASGNRAGRMTSSNGCTVEFLYTTDPDRIIEATFGALSSEVSLVAGVEAHRVLKAPQRGPVIQWTFDRAGQTSERSDISVTARLGEIRVVSTEGEGCVPPLAYLDAKRAGTFDAVTRRALDRQLGRIDPAIVKLRPRFALPAFDR
jgi:hypothetical protein